MSGFQFSGFVALGLLAGFCSGLLGIGGAAIIIPILVMAFGFTQHGAQGTTLVLLSLPLGLIPAWQYYRTGNARIAVALVIALGFVAGSFLGARFALKLPQLVLQRVFGAVLLAVALRYLFAR